MTTHSTSEQDEHTTATETPTDTQPTGKQSTGKEPTNKSGGKSGTKQANSNESPSKSPSKSPNKSTKTSASTSSSKSGGSSSGTEESGATKTGQTTATGTDKEVRLPATSLLFQAPDMSSAPRRKPKTEQVEASDANERGDRSAEPREPRTQSNDPDQQGAGETKRDSHETKQASDGDKADSEGESSHEQEDGPAPRRRRRRGGRGRRNRSQREAPQTEQNAERSDEGSAAVANDTTDETPSHEEDHGGEGDEGSTRRRRRRRRSGTDDDGSSTSKEGRVAREEITALKGSTRLEAKRQRRREGRDAGRRRPLVTESEFLARRESVDRSMVVREGEGRTEIAVLEDDVLVEHYVAQRKQAPMVGNVYLGRVQNVLPSMEAAFVDIGKGRNAILYAGEVNWEAAGTEGQPRRIEQALSSGDSVLVQVSKDPVGHKGARLTGQVTLAGRFLVLVPSGAMTGISRKLPDSERSRLKKLLKEIVPDGAGVIVRTAAEGATEEQLRADVERLMKQWHHIQSQSGSAKSAPQLLHGEPELAVRVVRDVFNEDFSSLTVSGNNAWRTISAYVKELSPDLVDRMKHWSEEKDVFTAHRIDEQLAKGMDRKVYLPSGGSLIIDRTEAMSVVDVNTGKFTGSGGTLEETVTKNNLEAAEEIARQLRLRDIGGIIVIDFIDMVVESNRDLVLRRLVECLARDRTRHQVAEVTSLGLVQMTRKRVGQGLVETFSTTCEHCAGRGFIVHDHPVEAEPTAKNGGSPRRGKRGEQRQSGGKKSSGQQQDTEAREEVKATLATIAAAAANAGAKEEAGAEHSKPEGTSASSASTPAKGRAHRSAARKAGPPAEQPSTTAEPEGEVTDKTNPSQEPTTSAGRAETSAEVADALDALKDSVTSPLGSQQPASPTAPRAGVSPDEAIELPQQGAPSQEDVAAPPHNQPTGETAEPSQQEQEAQDASPKRRGNRRVTSSGPVTA